MKPVVNKALFYFLSFTWGLPMNIAGLFIAAAMLITFHKPRRWGPCIYFETGKNWGGASWGMFFLVNKDSSERLRNHEMGHSFQNCYLGFFMPFIVGFPSVTRYWARRIWELAKRPSSKDYDAIWFEGSATRLGYQYWEKTKSL